MPAFSSPYSSFKSAYPVNVYVVTGIPVILLLTGLMHQISLNIVMMNLPIILLLFYLLFSRHSCKVEITDDQEMKIIYFFPWEDNLTIDPEDFKSLHYEKKRRRCYNIIRLTDSTTDEVTEIKLNMSRSALLKLLDFLRDEAKLQIIGSDPVQQTI